MQSKAQTPEQYLEELPEDRRSILKELRSILLENLPQGYEETMNYGMIGYVVPHSIYPAGYHTNPDLPLPFINLANQKNHIALYHMGLATDAELNQWFTEQFVSQTGKKPDLGKSCLRFKKKDDIPYKLIGQLVRKMKPKDWIVLYESSVKR